MRVRVILNTRSGAVFSHAGRADRSTIARLFAARSIDAELVEVSRHGLSAALDRAVADRVDAVAVCGGDGTVSAAARGLAGSGMPLGIVPTGTFNYYARLLGLPLDPEGAVAVIASGRAHSLDGLEVNGLAVVAYCSVGIFPRFILERTLLQSGRGWRKAPAMAVALVRSLVRFPVLDITLRSGGQVRTVRTPYLLAGNSACSLNPMLLRTGGALSSLADGTFSLYLSRHTKRRALLWAAAKAAVGRIDLDRDFELLELDRCEVGSDRRMLLVAADGELYRMRPPLDCRIRPGLFRIIAPEGGGGEAQCPPRRTAR